MPQSMGKVSDQIYLFFWSILWFCAGLLFLFFKNHNWIMRIMNIGKLHSNAVWVVVTKSD